MTRVVRAAVLEEIGGEFKIDTVELEPPRSNEVLVELAGTGICHTDIKVASGHRTIEVPVVLGHEGAGTVLQTGSDVTAVVPGDQVVMSFNSCGVCRHCEAGHPAICDDYASLTFGCRRPDGTSPLRRGDEVVHGYFFGQSSFATHAITTERNLARVDAAGVPLELLGPLGCGIQTGAGAVLRALGVERGASFVVFGAGSVGLSALMAASLCEAGPIVAVDRHRGRLDLASELGATHTIDTSTLAGTSLADAVRDVCAGGATYTLDTTNVAEVCAAAFEALGHGGTYAHVGGGGLTLSLDTSRLLAGRTVRGVLQGDSIPAEFIPELVAWWREGRFPFDRLVTYYDLDDINQAVADMHDGQTIKPVLRMGG